MAIQSDFLKSTKYFSDLDLADIASFASFFFEKKAERGEMFLLEDETDQVLYFVVSGAVKVLKTSAEGKEQILNIFDETDIMRALSRFAMWFSNVEKSGFAAFREVAKTLKNYLYGIMNYFYYRITNAGAEAINNKINIVKRRAYGFRDLEYFMLKILQSCGWRSS